MAIRTVVTWAFVLRVVAIIRDGPDKTVGECARQLGVSRHSVERAIREYEPDRANSCPIGVDGGGKLVLNCDEADVYPKKLALKKGELP